MAGETILVVDDTPINLKLTRILLAREGYATRTAASAEEALASLKESLPHLILADILLPGMDGLEFTRLVKADPRTRRIPVVALSALASADDEKRAREAGCDGYISKPIDTHALPKRLRQILDGPLVGAYSTSAPTPVTHALRSEDLTDLRTRFLKAASSHAAQFMAALDGEFPTAEASKIVHQWVGTGGLLGYGEISRIARSIEDALREQPLDNGELRDQFEALVRELANPTETLGRPN